MTSPPDTSPCHSIKMSRTKIITIMACLKNMISRLKTEMSYFWALKAVASLSRMRWVTTSSLLSTNSIENFSNSNRTLSTYKVLQGSNMACHQFTQVTQVKLITSFSKTTSTGLAMRCLKTSTMTLHLKDTKVFRRETEPANAPLSPIASTAAMHLPMQCSRSRARPAIRVPAGSSISRRPSFRATSGTTLDSTPTPHRQEKKM